MPGGVAGAQPIMAAPYADWQKRDKHLSIYPGFANYFEITEC